MTIEHAGHSFSIFTAPIIAWARRASKATYPQVILGCERCETSCLTRVPGGECRCCRDVYKKRTAGGTLVYPTISGGYNLFAYDPAHPKHVPLGRFAELVKL